MVMDQEEDNLDFSAPLLGYGWWSCMVLLAAEEETEIACPYNPAKRNGIDANLKGQLADGGVQKGSWPSATKTTNSLLPNLYATLDKLSPPTVQLPSFQPLSCLFLASREMDFVLLLANARSAPAAPLRGLAMLPITCRCRGSRTASDFQWIHAVLQGLEDGDDNQGQEYQRTRVLTAPAYLLLLGLILQRMQLGLSLLDICSRLRALHAKLNTEEFTKHVGGDLGNGLLQLRYRTALKFLAPDVDNDSPHHNYVNYMSITITAKPLPPNICLLSEVLATSEVPIRNQLDTRHSDYQTSGFLRMARLLRSELVATTLKGPEMHTSRWYYCRFVCSWKLERDHGLQQYDDTLICRLEIGKAFTKFKREVGLHLWCGCLCPFIERLKPQICGNMQLIRYSNVLETSLRAKSSCQWHSCQP
ncbi:uncharacterized protein BDR25DRAFT_361798 [Lindgomyces ingoldianus]|uniref:Uncharacterized protein n=1 Tax=Lindgomyces ingoldianus TaxID=673940 RepID=A0ACB6QBL2_9PLEO|nr:uncharacterized protein BDR25DRAFT_361798 [Lindgomyces ingoldianus]KAF2464296.1 hypothetical protein BDR25DRAFT_361798 [Lindgomyces ingoldianus]